MTYSAVIPAFNAEATLGEAIDSILAQTLPPAAIIVVDDGSTDATADVARRYGARVEYIHQGNAGPGAATTAGLGQVRTAFAATLDADDLWLPQKAELQIARLVEKPDLAAVFAHISTFRDSLSVRSPPTPGWSRITMTMRTELFAALGPIIDPPGMRGDIVDWIARAREGGHLFEMRDEVLALRRIRPGSLSYGRDGIRDRGYVHVAWQAIQRRRQNAGEK